MVQRPSFLATHPALASGVTAAILVSACLWFLPNAFGAPARLLIGWDALTAVYIAVLLISKRKATAAFMEANAYEDEGRHLILAVCLAAAAASVFAIASELASARAAEAPVRSARIAFVFVTIALSWLFTHLTFASHYAHEYYAPDEDGEGMRAGLMFPGGDAPDFADFMHFALVIGVANQTADVQISSRAIRRTVTTHGIVAFLFNTVVLAVSVNFAASLFS